MQAPITWASSGGVAIAVGVAAWLGLLIPLVLAQYRSYGGLSAPRLIGSAAVSIYLVSIAAYTLLPLPPRTLRWCEANAVTGAQTEPFLIFDRISTLSQRLSPSELMVHLTVLEAILNVILFIPWGAFCRGYFHRGALLAVVTGGLASVIIEATQYTGLWGIYPCAYRVADVDDLMLNTAGALIGAILAPVLLWWMPRSQVLASKRRVARRVTAGRRMLAVIFDGIAFGIAVLILGVVGRVMMRVAGLEAPPFFGLLDQAALGVAWVAVIVIPVAIQHCSMGEHAVYLRADFGPRHEWATVRAIVRACVVSAPVVGLMIWAMRGNPTTGLALVVLIAIVAAMVLLGTAGARSVGDLAARSVTVDARGDATDAAGVRADRTAALPR